MSLCKAFLFVISFSIATAAAVPSSQRNEWYGGRLTEHSNLYCKKLPADVAQYCGYNYTYFLDNEGHHKKSLDGAVKEFKDFIPLMNSDCSTYLGTLLCFYYFPLSNCQKLSLEELGTARHVSVFPCRETCDAAKNGSCKSFAQSLAPPNTTWDWPKHFQDCADFVPRSSPPCSYGEKTVPFIPILPPLPSTSPVPTTAMPTSPPPTKAPFKCPKACSFRNNLSRKTFRDSTNNNGYTYALKATITSAIIANKLTVEIIEGYDVSSCVDNSVQPLAEVGQTVTITVPCTVSDKLSVVVGQTVVIAGTHTVNADGVTEFFLDCNIHKPLLGEFKKKYDLRSYANDGKC